MPKSEHNIQNEIRIWCGQHNLLCFLCNVGIVKTIDGRWFDTGLPDGFSDLLILDNSGHVYFCECKTKIGKQRQDQINFEREVTKRGFIYFVARSVDDIQNIFKKYLQNI